MTVTPESSSASMRFGFERVEPPEDRLELSGLRRRNGIGKERRGAVLAEIADALCAEVRIEHDERGGVERI